MFFAQNARLMLLFVSVSLTVNAMERESRSLNFISPNSMRSQDRFNRDSRNKHGKGKGRRETQLKKQALENQKRISPDVLSKSFTSKAQ